MQQKNINVLSKLNEYFVCSKTIKNYSEIAKEFDLVKQNQDPKPRKVTIDEAKNFAESNDLIFLGECSAKENTYMPFAENTCYKQEELKDGNCLDGVTGIFKDILSNIVKKQKFQGE